MQSKSTKKPMSAARISQLAAIHAAPRSVAQLAHLDNIRASGQKVLTDKSHYQWIIAAIKNHDSDDCLLWPFAKDKDGYGKLCLKGKDCRAHRVAFFVTYGHWPSNQTRHTCDNPPCFNPRHLLEGSNKDNSNDAVERNRLARGEAIDSSKLTDEIVREIRADYPFYKQAELARRYSVSRHCIWSIVHRKTWRHVD